MYLSSYSLHYIVPFWEAREKLRTAFDRSEFFQKFIRFAEYSSPYMYGLYCIDVVSLKAPTLTPDVPVNPQPLLSLTQHHFPSKIILVFTFVPPL